MDNHGYDPAAYKDVRDFYFGRVLWCFNDPDKDHFRIFDSSHWDYARDPEMVELFSDNGGKGRAAFVRTGFSEGLLATLYECPGKAWPLAHRIGYLYPSGDNMMSRFTEMLIDSDIDVFLYGFCDCHACAGGEGKLRSFTGEFISLPNARFTALEGPGFDANIAIKEAGGKDEYFLCLANPAWWECDVRLKVSGNDSRTIRYARTGRPVVIGEDNSVKIALKPYAILGLTGSEADLKPIGTEVETPDSAKAFLKRELAEIEASHGRNGPEALASAGQAIADGDFAGAWRLMSTRGTYSRLLTRRRAHRLRAQQK
jgi:hypothetical protein